MFSTTKFTRFYVIILILAISSCSEDGIELVDGNNKLQEMASKANLKKIDADFLSKTN